MRFLGALRFSHIRIARKLAIAFTVVVLLTCALSVRFFFDLRAVVQSTGATQQTYDILRGVDEMMIAVLNMDTSVNAFLSAPEDAILDPYRQGEKAFDAALARVKSLTAGDARQQERLAELGSLVANLKSQFYAQQITLAKSQTTRESAIMMMQSGYGKLYTDKARGMLADIVKTEDEALRHRNDVLAAALGLSQTVVTAGTAVVVMLAILLGVALTRAIARPTARMTEAMRRLADGDTDVEIRGGDRRDEIGAMAAAVEVFRANAVARRRLEAEQREREAEAAVTRRDEMRRLAGDFESAVGAIVDTVSVASTDLERAAGSLAKTAETTQQLSSMVAEASEHASSNVQSVASAAEEMTSSLTEISRRVQESSTIAGEAVAQAHATDARIAELSQAAARIGDVVKLITAIAEQTNLLALNATIEAARAGEAGKGFAVVASEVKQLAAQTAKATDEIGAQIGNMQAATQESVVAIKQIGGTIGRISEIAATIAAAVEEQGAATSEIARNVQQAAQGTAQVADNIGDVNQGANETGAAATRMLGSAQSLSHESGRLKAEVERFLQGVRAA